MKKRSMPSLAYINGTPCVTISMNIQEYKDDDKSRQELERLANQARSLLLRKYKGIPLDSLFDKIDAAARKVDFDNGLKSITLFISENVEELLTSVWKVPENNVWVADHFDVRPLVTVQNTSEEYFILRLDQKKGRLYHASDNKITGEVRDADFPVNYPFSPARRHKATGNGYSTIDEFFNSLDKRLICRYNATSMRYVIAGCPTTYKRFMQHVRFQSIYAAYIPVRTKISIDRLAAKAWELLLMERKRESRRSIGIVKKLIADGKALTGYPEILTAARAGKGDLLVVSQDIVDKEDKGDVFCEIVWDVIKHRGKVIFADREEMEDAMPMALKLKY